jgi:hypothetical protein
LRFEFCAVPTRSLQVRDEIDADENHRRHAEDPGQEVLAHVALLKRKLR